ncbi:hexapeptide transferase [Balneolaceae bacterium YR4-1]|uniref:Hexapeptide transferase n=1 Tax=Halalkalibaculum roseum TaxID=2709311 RepID=A0A6M1T8W5_9BACT|nr:sugar-transfer associated ATP-grasp domain-containing protein [Halalkalibaculum roseum]NGP76673.1 hexapeptide transferase [Halalkalibaculum roseum]
MKLKRALYLSYYLKELDRKKLDRFLKYTVELTGRTKADILSDVLKSVFRYNISILEYFQFRFFELSKSERAKWAGTGYMYEYQLKMNPLYERQILDDKTLFYKKYRNYFVHRVADIEDLESTPELVNAILNNPSGKLVLKASDGKCGSEVEVRNSAEFDREVLVKYMKQNNYGLVEEFIQQHPEINRLSSSAVNTVRIITQVIKDRNVEILGCRMRISVDSPVDNMAAGNLAAPIDEDTGKISGPAVYSDITKPEEELHPVTSVKIPGFQVPFWNEALDMVIRAALEHPQNRSIGWDVVITEDGPGLIEGNHDWCKLLWQLPVKKGLKPGLENYLDAYRAMNKAELEAVT